MKIRNLAFSAFGLLWASQVFAVDGTGSIDATVNNVALEISETQALSFGSFSPTAQDGWLQVNAVNGIIYSDKVVRTGGQVHGHWEVAGNPGAPYAVVLPTEVSLLSSDGSNSLVVDGFHRTGNTSQLSIGSNGIGGFYVGATVRVPANAAAGTYSGTYEVSVAYN